MKFLTLVLISLLTYNTIEFEKRSFMDDKIEMLVPKTFKTLSKDEIKEKYKLGDKPAFVLTNDSATINFELYYNPEKLHSSEEEAFILTKSAYKAAFEEAFPGAVWKAEGTKVINKNNFWYAKLIHTTDGKKYYQYSFFTYIRKRAYQGTFVCPDYLLPEWEEAAEQMVNSFMVK
jgi:hypothetical protein